MTEKRGKGRPRAFETSKDFEQRFTDYIDYCAESKRFPNIAGFCRYCHITRETLYKQQEYYSDSYNIVMSVLEDEVLQDNTYRSQLYLKNKFGYRDKQEVDQTIKGNVTVEAYLRNMQGDEF